MIESYYWKEELARIADLLVRVEKPARWSERSHCVLERELMVGFFMLRRLIELNKVSEATVNYHMSVFSCKARGKRVTQMNGHRIWEMYDMEKEIPETKKPQYISNQFVHAYTSFIARDETRNWSDVFIVSDFGRNDCIWRVPVSIIRNIFIKASEDYPQTVKFEWNAKKGDYDVTAN
jgi:hypothetical protein